MNEGEQLCFRKSIINTAVFSDFGTFFFPDLSSLSTLE